MHLTDIPFETVDWSEVPVTEHAGEQGVGRWRTRTFGALRVTMVEYSAGYVSNHWCEKGHVLLVLKGELETELRDGRRFHLRAGTSYQVDDHDGAHRSRTVSGAKLF